jgi:hypothetical protein
MKNVYFKVLIVSLLCLFLDSCKSQSNVTKKEKKERTDTTDDVVDEQMDDYENEMKQQYEENNH